MFTWTKRILQIAVLFLFYYIGEAIQAYFSLVIPGSIIGMLLFFLLLTAQVIKIDWVEEGIDFIIKDMPIFFVPVTVGIIQYFDFFYGKGIIMIPSIILSTIFVIAIAGLLTQFTLKNGDNRNE
ncbi:CidA/LrgA family protein [Gracilibacillus sp. YIM 98692]|uniref:CidA/LrgA family protein n=1 Tax=Gracilibacillus sp. YIM 98692 TaxID=2663532 RepID=UPI0013D85CA5|nr:CidA/LrgA family protein [Gracilibacillus sp. YIM 98692]